MHNQSAPNVDMDDDSSQVSLTSTSSSTKKIDALLAKEMYQMSFDDRNRIQEELHGVRSLAQPESTQVVADAVSVLRSELDVQARALAAGIVDEAKWAFCQAVSLPASQIYLKSQELCLRYLRADRLDPTAASIRMVRHLRLLHKYFGIFALQRPLRLSDLLKQEQDVLRAGNNQVLLSRDRAGRLIAFSYGSMPSDGISDASRVGQFD